ncbi:MAG: Immunoglobulin I-set domain protein [Verrucomicrobiales bacterium]|nr:Immunoglobulin I-set domain protein [Verrucomicrobiales bacterium]
MPLRPALLLLALFLSVNVQAQQYWSQFTNSPTGTTRHDDFCFVNTNIGYATKGSLIHKTTDGGSNWVQVLSKPGTHFRSIAFVSPTRGWAGNLGSNSYDAAVTDTNVLYETFDGGTNWSVVQGLSQAGMKGFCAFHVLDSTHVYGGGRVRGPAIFCKTENAGTNWTTVNLTAQGVMNGIMDVYFKDPTNGFVVGMDTNTFAVNCGSVYHGRIARTTDGGQTWTPVVTTTLTCCYFWKMSWPSANVGYVSLQQNPTTYPNVIFYKTTDGGNTWVSNGIPLAPFGQTSFYLQGLGFVSEDEGWMGGNANTVPYNYLHTLDGGTTWSAVGYNNTASINRIRFASPLLGYASGQKLQVYRAPLAITSHPTSQTVLAGTNVQFTATAIGNNPISFQWRKNGTPITNQTSSTLTLTNVARLSEGSYSVTITNSGATLTSKSAALRVLTAQQFQSLTLFSAFARVSFGDPDGGSLTSNDLQHFSVESSSNLVDWQLFTNGMSLTNGRARFDDPIITPDRFYRVSEH